MLLKDSSQNILADRVRSCAAGDEVTPGLQVTLSASPVPPAADHELLLAFHFGAGPPASNLPGIVRTRLSPIGQDELYECWWVRGEVEHSTRGPIRIAESDDYAVIVFEDDERGQGNFSDFTRAAYTRLLDAIDSTQHPHLLKVWNYMGGINEGEGDAERYRQFTAGRAVAFDEAGLQDCHAPTATGIGTTRMRGLTIIAITSRGDLSLSENPRQTSAFHYPRQYGPRSPKFGRAASVEMQDYRLCLISGTASIVGHESLHPENTKEQLNETLRNLRALCEQLSITSQSHPQMMLGDKSVLRVYLRNPDDYEFVARRLNESLVPGEFEAAFLRGDICRRELTVEIDGVQIR
jgi:chorismate lyase/3-hydroxybenzoate synthase